MAYAQGYEESTQAAIVAAALLPFAALQDVLAFIGDQHCPGQYVIAGVKIEAIDSLDCPGKYLDAIAFNGNRVEMEAIRSFRQTLEVRIYELFV